MADKKISGLTTAGALTGIELVEVVQGGVNKQSTTQDIADLAGSGITRELDRAWSEEILFDYNVIKYTPHALTGDVVFSVAGTGNLVDQESNAVQIIQTDGTHAISFSEVPFIYGIANGGIPEAGTYTLSFLYINGVTWATWMSPSSEAANIPTLLAPGNFVALGNGENQIDLSWDDVANESSYMIEKSATGAVGTYVQIGGTIAAGTTSYSDTGLTPGDTFFYRIRAVGDGVSYSSSPYSTASASTESSGDTNPPTFTFFPANGDNTWPVNRALTITSNESLRDSDGVTTIDNSNVANYITLKQTNSGGANIAFTATIDVTKTVITIQPAPSLGVSQLVYLAIDGVEDVSGNESPLTSITFTTTEAAFFNGSSNFLMFGDILDSIFAANDTRFKLKLTVSNLSLAGSRSLVSKWYSSGNQRSFLWYVSGDDIRFSVSLTNGSGSPGFGVIWTDIIDSAEHDLELHYDGTIDTGNGLDRVTLLIDGVTAGSKSLAYGATLPASLFNATSQLAVGASVSSAGLAEASLMSGECKDFILTSGGSDTVEINVPDLVSGLDTSGNSRNGTWV